MDRNIKPFELEVNSLGFYLNRALWAMIKYLNKELKDSNLDFQHSDFTILKALDSLDGATQSQIALVLDKERSGIGRSISSLESKGYIKREPLNGSTNYVTLTEKGKQTIPVINEVIERVTAKAFKGFSQRSKTSTINHLNRIFQNSIADD